MRIEIEPFRPEDVDAVLGLLAEDNLALDGLREHDATSTSFLPVHRARS